jgi:hypothetical protein
VSYYWATWLAEALGADPWLAPRIIERGGWQTFGRPPADFSFNPSGFVSHHTACMARTNHDPQGCINGIVAGNSSAPGPIAQLLGTWTPPGTRWNGSNADPRIVVIAAGRANHAGDGVYPWGAPSGNGSSIGIEWCGPPDTGAGPWPDVVVECYERVAAALLRHCGWTTRQLTTHWEYGTPRGRKIDPSGPYVGQPTLASLTPWDPATWRARIDARLATDPEDDDMALSDDDVARIANAVWSQQFWDSGRGAAEFLTGAEQNAADARDAARAAPQQTVDLLNQ